MRAASLVVTGLLLTTLVAMLVWSGAPSRSLPKQIMPAAPSATAAQALRIALVPERDIFAQHRRYRGLADYISTKVGQPVELVTLNTYQAILTDFADKQVDAAFLGSLVAVLAMDRLGAQVLVKPQMRDGGSTYRGVIFVRNESPVRQVADLAGRSVASVKTTTAGDLFLYDQLAQQGLLGGETRPRLVWVGTHDDVVLEVVAGRVDAGAAKDLRVQEYMQQHPEQPLRWLAVSAAVPNNALVARAGMDEGMKRRLVDLLKEMDSEPAGREVLETLDALRFVRCGPEEYSGVFDMVQRLGEHWGQLELGDPPRRAVGVEDTAATAGGEHAAP